MVPSFKAFNFYLLRVPRLPVQVATTLNGLSSKKEIWDYVFGLLESEEIREALFIASSDLSKVLAKIAGNVYNSSSDKVLSALYKYLSRMSWRPTPYGKFSGVALGAIGEFSTSIELSNRFRSFSRFDMGFLGYLSELALQDFNVRSKLSYFTNSTLYETTANFRYINFEAAADSRRFHWVEIKKNPFLIEIVRSARNGAQFENLLTLLQKFGVSEERACCYLHKLIDEKLLISELEPCVTAFDWRPYLSRIKAVASHAIPILEVNRLEDSLCSIDRGEPCLNESHFSTPALNFPVKGMIQVDLSAHCTTNRLNEKVVESFASELSELSFLNKGKPRPELEIFQRKFLSRYGDQQVPILEAINPQSGIGYGETVFGDSTENPLIQGLGLKGPFENEDRLQEGIVQKIMNRYFQEGAKHNYAIELSPNDLGPVDSHGKALHRNLPPGFFALGNLLSAKNSGRSEKYVFNLLFAGGASSIPLMTRFGHLNGKLKAKLEECAKFEEDYSCDVVIAEVVFMPEARTGNILTRPRLFKYEIPVLGRSSVGTEFTIALDDLYVTVSGGLVTLRSKRLNKQVIPRLSTAHNFNHGMVIYRFLCDLQYQSGNLDLSWDWGKFLNQEFLPRVCYKNLILSRARWNISKTPENAINGDTICSKIRFLKERLSLPDVVILAQHDNELLLDLKSPLGAEILLKELGKHSLVLYESLLDDYHSAVKDAHGNRYNNELVIPFKGNGRVVPVEPKSYGAGKVRRSFFLGSEWVYVKIYCSSSVADRILCDSISQLVDKLEEEKIIEKWFFIRFSDPEPHIRLRFLVKQEDKTAPFQDVVRIIAEFFEPFVFDKLIYRIVYDTYERELERYGEGYIEVCESIFHVDSSSVLSLLQVIKETKEDDIRWLSALAGVEHLLELFALSIEERITLLRSLRDAFLIEFQGYQKLKYKLDQKYRKYSSRVISFMNGVGDSEDPVYCRLFQRLTMLEPLTSRISNKIGAPQDRLSLVSSLSHMYINRTFKVKHREHEMVIYHFLLKFYIGVEKRKKSVAFESGD